VARVSGRAIHAVVWRKYLKEMGHLEGLDVDGRVTRDKDLERQDGT
jgi:hypothetical protein